MPLPRERRIFFTDFLDFEGYDASIDYGGTELPDHYDVTGDVFTNREKYLEVSGTGNLLYNDEFEHADFGVYALVRSTDNAVFSIQNRYTLTSSVQAVFDFSDNTVTLEEIGSSSAAVVSTFNFSDDTFYLLGLWAYEDMFYVWVNDYQISSLAMPGLTAKTFALDFISGDINVYQVKVYELLAPIDPTLEEDSSNLLVEYRKFLQEKLATVTNDDWDAYREAHNRNRWNRNIGRRNINWGEIGYPAPKPSTDAFFN